MRSLLMLHGKDLAATEDEKYDFVVGIAAGHIKTAEIVAWLSDHT